MIPRTPFAQIGVFCLQNNMVPNKWRDFMRKNRLMPQKEVALVSQYLKIRSCTPATLHQVFTLNSTFWFDVGILAIKKLFSSCSPKRIFGIKVLKFTEKTILFKYVEYCWKSKSKSVLEVFDLWYWYQPILLNAVQPAGFVN